MALIKYDTGSFMAAMEPGLCALVMHEFESKLEAKLNKAVEETYAELRKELPDKVKANIERVISPDVAGDKIQIEVVLNERPIK